MKHDLSTVRDPAKAAQVDSVLKLAIFAVGGQGGGVLNSWIVDLAERSGYDAQATSVAGVAQRTGSTIYYVEMLPKTGVAPVFALAPSEGDVDILIAAELMEAGRAVGRNFVTPNKTQVIMSTHRQLATVEKIVPGNGEADGAAVIEAVKQQADAVVAFDMQTIAEQAGTVISASLFGALAGSGALPFDLDTYRETIRASGRGVDKSLAAFEAARRIAAGEDAAPSAPETATGAGAMAGPEALMQKYGQLVDRVRTMPAEVGETALHGVRKLIDFQDLSYAEEYLDRLDKSLATDAAERGFAYTATLAKYLANAMAYDDVIRVADAKTRVPRRGRIAQEVGATDAHLVRLTEYTHPGGDEVISMMPRGLGAWIEARPNLARLVDRLVNRGRHIRTDRIGGFLSLYLVAGLRRWRRRLLRHRREVRHIEAWLTLAEGRLEQDYDFAVATLRTRRLIKGYSDTHARGMSKFDRVTEGTHLVEGRSDAASWTDRLIAAALADPKGEALEGALKTIDSFLTPSPSELEAPPSLSAAE